VSIETPDQLMPNIETSEMSIISILMNAPDAFDECQDLEPHHFVTDWLKAIFVEMRRQHAKGPFDVITLSQALEGVCTIDELHHLNQYHGYSRRAVALHAAKLIDAYKSRQLYRLGGILHELAFETTPIRDRLDKAGTELLKLEDKRDADEWVDAHTASIEHLALIEARDKGLVHGMQTGLNDLDGMLDGGLQRGNLFVIGARPTMGKTALGLTVALCMAQEYSVGFLSMEMSHADIRDRQTAILGNASISAIKQPQQHGLEWSRVVDSVERAKTLRFYVTDRAGLNILQVRSKARALKRSKALDVLVVDYIGLMSGTDSKTPRAYQIEEISRGLKALAKDLDIVVICLAQVNRGAADRGNHAPALHELRDSGSIEQDADVVAFIHRPIVASPELGGNWKDYALLRLAKNRQGKTGDVHLLYVAERTQFGAWSGAVPTKSNSATKENFE
jgi:replicative DNA helicase